VDIYSTRNKIKIITILKDTSLELSKASLLTPFYGMASYTFGYRIKNTNE